MISLRGCLLYIKISKSYSAAVVLVKNQPSLQSSNNPLIRYCIAFWQTDGAKFPCLEKDVHYEAVGIIYSLPSQWQNGDKERPKATRLCSQEPWQNAPCQQFWVVSHCLGWFNADCFLIKKKMLSPYLPPKSGGIVACPLNVATTNCNSELIVFNGGSVVSPGNVGLVPLWS